MDGEKSFNNVQDRHDFFKILKLGIKRNVQGREGRRSWEDRREGKLLLGCKNKNKKQKECPNLRKCIYKKVIYMIKGTL